MQEILINNIKQIEKYLKEKQIKSKIIDRMYNLEYKTTDDVDEKSICLDIIPEKNKVKMQNEICYILNNSLEQDLFKELVKLLSLNVAKSLGNKLIVKTGFSETEYKNINGEIEFFEDPKNIFLNLGVLEYIVQTMYIDIINKPYERKICDNNLLTNSYLAGEITRILNFIIFETEDNTELLNLYFNNKKEVFLNKIEEKLKISETEIYELYEIATLLLSPETTKKTMHVSDEYKMKFLKKFFIKAYKCAKENNIRNTDFFFATEFNRDVVSLLS